MDRAFAFLDQQSLLRPQQNPNNHTSSSTVLPHSNLLQSHQNNPNPSNHPNPNMSSQPLHNPHSSHPPVSAHQSMHLHPMDSHDHHNPSPQPLPDRQSSFQMHHLQSQSSSYQNQQVPSSVSVAMPQAQSLQAHQQRQQRSSHQHQQLNALSMPHTANQINPLSLSTSSAPNYVQNTPHFPHAVPSRESSHPNAYPIQSASPQGSQQLQTGSFGNIQPIQGVSPINMQPLIRNQPQSQSFHPLAQIPGSMLHSGVVEEANSQQHHFPSSQHGDALSAAAGYPWDPSGTSNPQNLSNQAQQSLVPLPLVGDTRSNAVNSAQSPPSNYSNQQGQNFGQGIGGNMGVLGSSINSAMVGGLQNGTGLAPNVSNVQSALSPATDLSTRNPFPMVDSANDGPSKTIKKPRTGIQRKPSSVRMGRNSQRPNPDLSVNVTNASNLAGRAPITSPVSTTTIPNSTPQASPSGNPASPSMGQMRGAQRPMKGSKVKGRMRSGMDDHESRALRDMQLSGTSSSVVTAREGAGSGPTEPIATRSSATAVAASAFQGGVKHMGAGVSGGGGVGGVTASGTNVAWSNASPTTGIVSSGMPIATSTSRKSGSRRSRRKGDPNAVPVPVHLRNPKKGRARVFRECKACGEENHIRRSDCSSCKSPLPAGKRRRDGNSSYDSRRRAAAPTVPSGASSSGAIHAKQEHK